jgi:hypothetical protein
MVGANLVNKLPAWESEFCALSHITIDSRLFRQSLLVSGNHSSSVASPSRRSVNT